MSGWAELEGHLIDHHDFDAGLLAKLTSAEQRNLHNMDHHPSTDHYDRRVRPHNHQGDHQ